MRDPAPPRAGLPPDVSVWDPLLRIVHWSFPLLIPAIGALTAILGVFEISLSFDNAVINATILRRMSEFWQKIFLTIGILIAVFGMRLVFPLVIVWLASGLNPVEALDLALNPPPNDAAYFPNGDPSYETIITDAHPQIAAFGGMFLLMLFLGFFFGQKEITWAALSVLVVPTLVLGCSAVAVLVPGTGAALNNSGPHGLSEVLYAYASAANNNGSAFAGLTASDEWFTLSLAFCMLLGRFATIAVVLGLAGALAARTRRPATRGTLPTATPTFAVLLLAVTLLVAGLTYLPALALGPIGEALS